MTNLLRLIAGLLFVISVSGPVPAVAQKNEALSLNARVGPLFAAGKYAEALPLAQRALAVGGRTFGPDHRNIGVLSENLARIYYRLGRYADAEPLFKRSLAIQEKLLGPSHVDVAETLNNLAVLYDAQGRYDEEEPLHKRTLAIRERALGPEHSDVAVSLNNLAGLYLHQGRYSEAEPLYQRSLRINTKVRGSNHPDAAFSLSNLAVLYEHQGRYAEAEAFYTGALAVYEKARGVDHSDLALTLNNLSSLYRGLGRNAEAEPLSRRSLAVWEEALGPDHPSVALALRSLASIYYSLDRLAEAEPLARRSLAIRQKAAGPDSPDVADALNLLGEIYRAERRYADAAPLLERGLAIREKALGPDHPAVALSLRNLAIIYASQGHFAEAESLDLRSLAIREKALGADHPDIAQSLNSLAILYRNQGRYSDAEQFHKRALAIREKTLGPDHRDFVESLRNLAIFYLSQARYADALPVIQRAMSNGRADPYVALPVLYGARAEKLISDERAFDDGLNVVQRGSQSSAASALGKLAVRLAAANDRLAQLVRKDQDITSEADALDRAIIAAVSREPAKRDPAAEQRTKDRLAAVASERATLQQTFAAEFPDYAALSNPLPMPAKEIQALLSADEALVLFAAAGYNESYVFSLTREKFIWETVPLGADALSQKVAAFRRGLDVDQLAGAGKTTRLDLGLANELYAALLGPVEILLKDKKQLLVVPSGALTALPFHLLVTESPVAAVPEKFEGYRDAAWLIKRQAVSVLPSVASLKALRAFARKDQGSKPMIGFGDPVFDPDDDTSNARVVAAKPATAKSAMRSLVNAPYTDFWQGAGIDRSKLARALPRLPDTAEELNAVALKLGSPASDIHLGRDASETTLKRASLADYRIVYFATHGLVAGDVKGLAEPSLVLSIPKRPSELDDGLLTASEVAQLKLNADWVVLSACNTIAGDKPGAEALSGLARSFFYAGARALLVSHWAVDSQAATRLTISTFDNLKANPAIGRAEALRQAMLGYLNDASSPQNAYPAFWGPFALIGEGAAR